MTIHLNREESIGLAKLMLDETPASLELRQAAATYVARERGYEHARRAHAIVEVLCDWLDSRACLGWVEDVPVDDLKHDTLDLAEKILTALER